MSSPIQIYDGETTSDITVSQCLDGANDVRLRVALVDDDPNAALLFHGLGFGAADAVVFVISDAATAYELFLSTPFPFDAVFVDWLLEGWGPFTDKDAARTGLPDTLQRGGAFGRVFQKADPKRARDAAQGGHAELLVAVAAARGAAVFGFSHYLGSSDAGVAVLRARGAHGFIHKQELGDPSQSDRLPEIEALLYGLGGLSRDIRLWRSLTSGQRQAVMQRLATEPAREIAERMSAAEAADPRDRHRILTSGADVSEYLIGVLAFLTPPRLAAASELLRQAWQELSRSTGAARETCLKIELLQPSLTRAGGSSLVDDLTARMHDIQAAYQAHRLVHDRDHLHVFPGADVERIDYYASKRHASAANVTVEYLGSAFSPKLAVAIEGNGVWPAPNLSKARHLLKAHRDQRLFHDGVSSVRCTDGVFGPTIDSLLLGSVVSDLVRAGGPLANVRSAVEVGTGTGYLLCAVAGRLQASLQLLVGSDVSPDAVAATARNLAATWPQGIAEGKAHVALSVDVLATLGEASIDLILTNPPYLPAKPSRAGLPNDQSAIAGERVICDVLIRSGPRALKQDGTILMVTSTLSNGIVERALAEAASSGTTWFCESILDVPWVPLDLPEVQEDRDWVNALLATQSPHVLFDPTSESHPLRHGVVVRALSRSREVVSQITSAL